MNQPTDGAEAWHALVQALGDRANLTDAENELLTLLIEECSEVIKVACKIKRAGYDFQPHGRGATNGEMLQDELKDVMSVMKLLEKRGRVLPIEVTEAMTTRRLRYTRYQNA